MPYNILFQKETRQSFSINLKNQIIIIDEAHNLIDAIAQIHSVEITDSHVTQSITQLNNYVNRYKSRFSAKNMLYLRHLLNILNGLNKVFTSKEDAKLENENGKLSLSNSLSSLRDCIKLLNLIFIIVFLKEMTKMWTVSEFLVNTKFFNLNFIKLIRFIEETQLEKKVNLE